MWRCTSRVTEEVGPETRFVDNALSINQEAVEEDKEIPVDKRTAKVLSFVANSVSPMITMVNDFPTKHPEGRF